MLFIMKISDAITQRIFNLCDEKKLSINRLAILSGLTQSTVQSLVNGKSNNPKLLTLVRICDTFNISLSEFFDDKLFKNIDTEL